MTIKQNAIVGPGSNSHVDPKKSKCAGYLDPDLRFDIKGPFLSQPLTGLLAGQNNHCGAKRSFIVRPFVRTD